MSLARASVGVRPSSALVTGITRGVSRRRGGGGCCAASELLERRWLLATFTVTTAADVVNPSDGVLSLREAVAAANATVAADTIAFAGSLEGQTLTLTRGQLTLTNDVLIDGDANNDGVRVTLSGGDAARVLSVAPGLVDASLSDLAIVDGRAADGRGGGILVGANSDLSLVSCAITSCYAGDRSNLTYGSGAAIYVSAYGGLRVVGSGIFGNSAVYGHGGGIACAGNSSAYIAGSIIADNGAGHGGGVWIGAGGDLRLERSSVTGNSAFDYNNGSGGGLLVEGSAQITGSLIADNDTAYGGGGIAAPGQVTLTDSTVANNRSVGNENPGFGGGLVGADLTLVRCTVTGNSSTNDGYYHAGAAGIVAQSLRIFDTIVSGNYNAGGPSDISGQLAHSNGRNLFGSGVAGSVPGDLENVDPALVFAAIDPLTGGGRLALNGGPTLTVALRNALDNPALGGGEPAAVGAVDQRGVARPAPGTTSPDIGAFELMQSLVSTTASANNDVLTGTSGADNLGGLAGADLILGLDGHDTLLGNDGSDVLRGDAGDDLLEGGLGSDWLYGGLGSDRVSYLNDAALPLGVTVDLRAGRATRGGETDRLLEIENVDGGNLADTLQGDAAANRLNGAGGVDRLFGRAGDDVLVGGLDNDRLDGDAGFDLADYAAGRSVIVDLSLTTDRATRGAEVDTLVEIEGAIGSAIADTFRGDGLANLFRGLGGRDVQTGGSGADVFDYDATADSPWSASRTTGDRITDFVHLADDLDLSTIDAKTGTPAVNDAFTFLAAGGAAFTGAGQVRWYTLDGNTFVEANTGGTLQAELQIQLDGLKTLTAADFLL